MTTVTGTSAILAQFERKSQPKANWLVKVEDLARFNDVVAKIKTLLTTGNGFFEAREALFLFETGRGYLPRSMTCKSVTDHPNERDALIDKIDDFLLEVLHAGVSRKKREFQVSKNWSFPKEVIALREAVKKTEAKDVLEEAKKIASMDVLGVKIEYSVIEADSDED